MTSLIHTGVCLLLSKRRPRPAHEGRCKLPECCVAELPDSDVVADEDELVFRVRWLCKYYLSACPACRCALHSQTPSENHTRAETSAARTGDGSQDRRNASSAPWSDQSAVAFLTHLKPRPPPLSPSCRPRRVARSSGSAARGRWWRVCWMGTTPSFWACWSHPWTASAYGADCVYRSLPARPSANLSLRANLSPKANPKAN